MPPFLHEVLRTASRRAGLSLNEYCVRRLAAGGSVEGDAPALLSRCAAILGGGFAALALYGSWVRGEAATDSDVDALIVTDAAVTLDRSLYRRWDEDPVTWRGRPVDPHFVHFPAPTDLSGMWAEAAVHGVALFDRDGNLEKTLVRLREAIAAGQLERRVAHGQPYWRERI